MSHEHYLPEVDPDVDRELDERYRRQILNGIHDLADVFAPSDLDLAIQAGKDLEQHPPRGRAINNVFTIDPDDGSIVEQPSWILHLEHPAHVAFGMKHSGLELYDESVSMDEPIASAEIKTDAKSGEILGYEEKFMNKPIDLAYMLAATREFWQENMQNQPDFTPKPR